MSDLILTIVTSQWRFFLRITVAGIATLISFSAGEAKSWRMVDDLRYYGPVSTEAILFARDGLPDAGVAFVSICSTPSLGCFPCIETRVKAYNKDQAY